MSTAPDNAFKAVNSAPHFFSEKQSLGLKKNLEEENLKPTTKAQHISSFRVQRAPVHIHTDVRSPKPSSAPVGLKLVGKFLPKLVFAGEGQGQWCNPLDCVTKGGRRGCFHFTLTNSPLQQAPGGVESSMQLSSMLPELWTFTNEPSTLLSHSYLSLYRYTKHSPNYS